MISTMLDNITIIVYSKRRLFLFYHTQNRYFAMFKKLIGGILIAIPFICFTWFSVVKLGPLPALRIWILVIIVYLIFLGGTYLLFHKDNTPNY